MLSFMRTEEGEGRGGMGYVWVRVYVVVKREDIEKGREDDGGGGYLSRWVQTM